MTSEIFKKVKVLGILKENEIPLFLETSSFWTHLHNEK